MEKNQKVKKLKLEKIIYYYLNNCKYDGEKGIIKEMEKVYSIMKMILLIMQS